MLVEFAKAGLLDKARRQPEKVRQVLEKVRADGLIDTVDAVRSRLNEPLPLGYSNVGTVVEAAPDCLEAGLVPGTRVLSNGAHAEMVRVPKNLAVPVPDGLEDDAAVFGVLGAIALQGIRLAAPTLGESFAVLGLGLIGLLTVQILRAAGVRVIGLDFNAERLELARSFGAAVLDLSSGRDPVPDAVSWSGGAGVDGVLVTASTDSPDPVRQAAKMSRKRGRIVLVGVAGLELDRADFYKKELTFQVSCSYGPGRYDPLYEDKGCDYPLPFVRWTEKRNMEAVLDLLREGRLDPRKLVSHRFAFERFGEAYREIREHAGKALGVILEYEPGEDAGEFSQTIKVDSRGSSGEEMKSSASAEPVLGMAGAGVYACRVLLPAIRKANVPLERIVSRGGASAARAAKRFGFRECSSDTGGLFQDPAINTLVIATRHDTHAPLVLEALRAGKHVFVEKPLCLNVEELETIEKCRRELRAAPVLMVGFNRRFSPFSVKMRELLGRGNGPRAFVYTVNAGALPAEHWLFDPKTGGGRIIGEACHFIDLIRFLDGGRIGRIRAVPVRNDPKDDSVAITLETENGSVGTIHYLAGGARAYPKERLEVFAGGRVLQLENWKILRGWGWKGFRGMRRLRQDKGHAGEMQAFFRAIREGTSPGMTLDEILEVHRAVFAADRSARTGKAVDLS
jgi:predicted dehydrogenase/threonine dehydrogenase-like Zn-dependent dehydrogenase